MFETKTFISAKNHLLCPWALTSHEIYNLICMMYSGLSPSLYFDICIGMVLKTFKNPCLLKKLMKPPESRFSGFFCNGKQHLITEFQKIQDFLNMEFAFKCGILGLLRPYLIPEVQDLLQYKLDIHVPVCLKQKLFLSYHVISIYFRIFGFQNLHASHRLNVNLPSNLCDAHLRKSTNAEIQMTCLYLIFKRSFFR